MKQRFGMDNLNRQTFGTVFWLTGLSGVGKTTLAKELISLFPEDQRPIWLDGDSLREIYADQSSYTYENRKQVAFKNARLCLYLSNQGFSVVCSTISLFHEVQNWNRQSITNYLEIWIKSPPNLLKERDPKKIYENNAKGLLHQVAGVDCPVEYPLSPDLIIENDTKVSIHDLSTQIFEMRLKATTAS